MIRLTTRLLLGLSVISFCSAESAWTTKIVSLPLTFEPNPGQSQPKGEFRSRVGGADLLLSNKGATLLRGGATKLRLVAAGARQPSKVIGINPTGGTANYYVGDPSAWRSGIPTYAGVRFSNIYDGIDWVFRGNEKNIEYDFLVAPGADPARIEVEFRGAQSVTLSAAGELVITAAGLSMSQHRAVIYQVLDGHRTEIRGKYVLRGHNRVGFRVGPYNHAAELVIDPVLSYSAIIGGSGVEAATAIAVDNAGNTYVTGSTSSASNFSSTGFQSGANQENVAFVYKLNPTATSLLYSAFIGGSASYLPPGASAGSGVTVDSSGSVYVTGTTNAADFPTTANAFQAGFAQPQNPVQHGFVLSLNPTGTALRYSTYLRGGFGDYPTGIAVDGSGSAYVAGYTNSPNFPVTSGAYQSSIPSTNAGFITKLNADGTGLIYSTFLGGPGSSFDTMINAVAVDTSKNVYVAGFTQSSNFPTTSGSFEPAGSSAAGGYGFVTKINTTGTNLLYSTFITGGGVSAAGITVDSLGSAYISGSSNFLDYSGLVTYGPAHAPELFVLKLNPQGSSASYMTRLGGSVEAHGTGVAIDPSGNAYVGGWTTSSDFPLVNPVEASRIPDNVTPGAALAQFDSNGVLTFSSYLGGQDNGDKAFGVAADSNVGTIYIAGRAGSLNFPVTPGAAGKASGDGFDTFVAAVGISSNCTFSLQPTQASFPAAGGPGNVTVTAPGGCNWIASSPSPLGDDYGRSFRIGGPGQSVTPFKQNIQPARSTSISIAGWPFSISQASGCVYSLTASTATVSSQGGNINVTLNTGGGCPWALSTLPSWVQWLSVGPPDSAAQFVFAVNANSGAARSSTLSIAGIPFTINQAGGFSCNFTLGPQTSKVYNPGGTLDSFSIITLVFHARGVRLVITPGCT